MTCTDMEVRIPELLAGETPADDRAAVEQHLMDCAGCRENFKLARLAWDAAARWHAPAPPAPLVQRTALAVRLGAAATPFQRRLLTFLRPGTAAAAAVFLALAVTSMGPQDRAPRGETARGRRVNESNRAPGTVLAAVSPSVGQLFVRDPESGKPVGEMEIRRIDARISIADGVARTEIEQVFYNTTDRQLEGTFFFPLPPDASIARLALEINGKLEDGVVEEAQKARQVYESIVRRMQDPALLEWQPGGVFKCRVFPILPKGERRIVIGYEQALPVFDARYRYVYPLSGESTREKGIGVFTLEATVRESSRVVRVSTPSHADARVVRPSEREAVCRFSDEAFKPDKDFVLDVEVEPAGELTLSAHRPAGPEPGWFSVFVAPAPDAVEGVKRARHVVFLVDASASVGTAQMDVARQLIEKMAATLGRDDKYLVASHNVELRTMGEYVSPGPAGIREANEFIYGIRPAGACDLERALRQLLPNVPEGAELVYIGEGTPTLGESTPAKLVGIARAALEGKPVTIRTVAVGSLADRPLLETLSREFNGGSHAVSPSDDVNSRIAEIARTLGRSALNDLKVEFEGPVTDVVPGKLGSIHFGERLIVAGRYQPGAAKMILTGKVHGREIRRVFPIALPEREDGNHNVRRLWAQRKLADLVREGAPRKDEAVALSKVYQVMCPYTSFIVLETAEAYEQYQISLKKANEDLKRGPDEKKADELAKKLEKRAHDLGEAKGEDKKLGRKADGDDESPKTESAPAPSGRPAKSPGDGEGRSRGHGNPPPPSGPARGADPARPAQEPREAGPSGAAPPPPRSAAPERDGNGFAQGGGRDAGRNLEDLRKLREEADHNETADEELKESNRRGISPDPEGGERARRQLKGLADRELESSLDEIEKLQREIPELGTKIQDFARRKEVPNNWSAGADETELRRDGAYSERQAGDLPKVGDFFGLRETERNRRINTLRSLSGKPAADLKKNSEQLGAAGARGGADGTDKGKDAAADAGPTHGDQIAALRQTLQQAVNALATRPRGGTETDLEFEGLVHYAGRDLPASLEAFLHEAASRRDSLAGIAGSAEANRAYEATLRLFAAVLAQAKTYAERQLTIVKSLDRARIQEALRELDAEWSRLAAAYREASFSRVGDVESTADPRREAVLVTRLDALVLPGDVLVVTRQGAFVAVLKVEKVEGSKATARVYADLWTRDLQSGDRAVRVHSDTELWSSLPESLRNDILSKSQLDRVRATMRALREVKAENPQ